MGNHFYFADDAAIELRKICCGNPVFLVNGAADGFDVEAIEKIGANLKTCDKTGSNGRICGVPVSGDLNCIFFVENRIKVGLPFEPRRELPKSRVFDKLKFLRSNRAEQRR